MAGMPGSRNTHLLAERYNQDALDIVETFRKGRPGGLGVGMSTGKETIYFNGTLIEEDLTDFLEMINGPALRKQAGIPSLGSMSMCNPPPYGQFDRFTHMVAAYHVTKHLCNKLGIEGDRRNLILAYALCHDIGHLVYGHSGEDNFKYKHHKKKNGFDHERTAKLLIRQEQEGFESVLRDLGEKLIDLFEERNNDHQIVTADLGGSDRLGYMGADPSQLGISTEFDPIGYIAHLNFDGETMWCDSAEKAAKFFLQWAKGYQRLYYGSLNQASGAYTKKILHRAGFKDVNDPIPLGENEDSLDRPLWQANNYQLVRYLCTQHPDEMVRAMARYWLLGFHSSPLTTVAVLKRPGYERCEGRVQVHDFERLTFKERYPRSEGVDPEMLGAWYQRGRHPDDQDEKERIIAERLEIPNHLMTLAASPHTDKFLSQRAAIQEGKRGPRQELFVMEGGRYVQPVKEVFNEIQGLRLCVHPQIWDETYRKLGRSPLARILREA